MAPQSLDQIPTISSLYRSGRLKPPPPTDKTGPPEITGKYEPSGKLNALISLVRTDITTLAVGAVVNAANNSLLGGGGVDGAIHAAAGPGLLRECHTLNGCATGSARITAGYELPAAHVIHAVGPVYGTGEGEGRGLSDGELLRGCYRRSLELSEQNAVGSVAFASISTGLYGYPSKEAARMACWEVRKWVDEKIEAGQVDDQGKVGTLERIVFCCFEQKDVRAYEKWIPFFFPPTPEDKAEDESSGDEDESLRNKLDSAPHPPSASPLLPGEPQRKKSRTWSSSSKSKKKEKEIPDDWEEIEHPLDSDYNGHPPHADHPYDLPRSTSIDEDAMTQEEAERQQAALHAAQIGGDPPRNALERDW